MVLKSFVQGLQLLFLKVLEFDSYVGVMSPQTCASHKLEKLGIFMTPINLESWQVYPFYCNPCCQS
jgi:hypothetical protein